jgi:hypothetical protein
MSDKSINAFLASNPAAAAKMGKYTLAARRAIEGEQVKMAQGGAVSLEDRLNAQRQGFMSANQQAIINQANAAFRARQVQQSEVAPAKTSVEIAREALMQSPEYMAMQEYGQNTAPNAIDQNRVKELNEALRGSDLYAQFEQEASTYAQQQPVNTIGYNNPVGQAPTPQVPIREGVLGALGQPPQGGSSGQVPPHSHTISMAKGGVVYAADGVDVQSDTEEEDKEATTDPVEEDTTVKTDSPANVMTKAITSDPTKLVTTADVQAKAGTGTGIAEGTGKLDDPEKATGTTAEGGPDVVAPDTPEAKTVETATVSKEVEDTLSKIEAATGKVGPDALAEAATMSPDQLASLGLTAAQISQAQTVKAPAPRKIEKGEMIEGSTVDMERVKKETNFEAATGAPSSDATVQGQLTGLMEDFEGGATPAWAAGAMRGAAAMMAARGLSASSMAGQAAIQAAMEAALPIAQSDASTFARFEQQNLSNRQQAAMFAAEKRAEFLGLEFNQEFQTRVANAAKISDIANMNFNAEQTIALENARLAQSVDLANLDARNAKVLADAAAMTQVDVANLNNRQQAAVENAKSFLKMDLANLDNEQQMSVIRAQEVARALLSDQAAENATRQFNATSQNQVEQFFASLSTQVAQFNTEQSNAMSRFNAGEANALAQFNTQQKNARDQFNATNHLVIAQANAAWAQAVTTADNAAQNQANRDAALFANNLTMTAYNNIVQRDRDVLAWAWQSGENAAQRDANILIAKIQEESARYQADVRAAADDTSGSAGSAAFGKFLGQLAINAADLIFG